jgi:hypothetical protein
MAMIPEQKEMNELSGAEARRETAPRHNGFYRQSS